MGSLLLVPGLDTRLARILLERRRVEYPTLHAALTKVRAVRQSAPHTLAQELVVLGLVEAADLEATIAGLLSDSESGVRSQAWAPGEVTAGLEVLGSLGAGGMGEVLLARDAETGSEVAVKTLRLDEDPELLTRFQREAEAQARVDVHPNVVRIHRSGVAGGRAFLVMDAVRGGDLAQRLTRGPLEPRTAARLVRDLARGLAYAHARGVLHRDLKPANVLFDERGTPRLADFGLARLLEAEALTQTGQILGTPSYMAPEQAQSDPQDERTDVYGLGGILYAALTGVPPFAGPTVYALLEQVLTAPAPDPRALVPQVPRELAAICARCLEKSPGDRFSSAQVLEEALEGFLEGRPEQPRFLRPALLACGALSLAAALGAFALESFPGSKQTRIPSASYSAEPSETPSPGSPPSEREVRDRVEAAGEGLEGALLAERLLEEGLGPVVYLRARSAKPFLRVRIPEVSGTVPLAGGQLLAWRGTTQIGGPPVAWLIDVEAGRVVRDWNERFLDCSVALGRCAFLTSRSTVRLLDTRTWEEVWQSRPVAVSGAVIGPDACWVVGRRGLGRIPLDSPSEEAVFVWSPAPGQDAAAVQALPNGDLLVASGRGEGSLVRFRLISPEGEVFWETPRQGIFDGKPRAIEVSPDGRWVLLGTSSGQIALFDTAREPRGERSAVRTYVRSVSEEGKPTAAAIAPRAQRNSTVAIAWLSNEIFLSVDDEPAAIHLWSRAGDSLGTELGRELVPRRVSFSRDRRICYVASDLEGLVTGVLRSSLLPDTR